MILLFKEIRMKFLKLSLAASVALGAFSTASFAQPLEEAIKGVDVKGYLRYRYTDDRYDNQGFTKDKVGGNARHQWRGQADFKTPAVNAISVNLGLLYSNNNTTNHAKGGNTDGQFYGSLPAGQDNSFNVRTLYLNITPDSTATDIRVGKQILDTPITDSDDRGVGFLAFNRDIAGLTLALGAFDTWSLDDYSGVGSGNGFVKPFYTLAAMYSADSSIGNIGAQAWGFVIDDVVDTSAFLELSWKHSVLNAKLQYAFAKLENGDGSPIQTTNTTALNGGNASVAGKGGGLPKDNDVLSFQIGADFAAMNVPFNARLGYLTNFQDGTVALLDNEGALAKAGKIWFDNSKTTAVNLGLGTALSNKTSLYGTETDLEVFYGAIGYGLVDGRLKLGLEAAFGENKMSWTGDIAGKAGQLADKTKFTEITPTISFKYNKNLNLSAYYAMLSTENSVKKDAVAKDTYADEDRNRLRLEARYSF